MILASIGIWNKIQNAKYSSCEESCCGRDHNTCVLFDPNNQTEPPNKTFKFCDGRFFKKFKAERFIRQ